MAASTTTTAATANCRRDDRAVEANCPVGGAETGCHWPIDPKRWSGCAGGTHAELAAGAHGDAAAGAQGDGAVGAVVAGGVRCPVKKSKSLDTMPPVEWRVDLRRVATLA